MDQALNLARREPDQHVLVSQDQGAFYRQPTQGWLWAACGGRQPRMPYSHRSNIRMRVVSYPNAVTGAVHTQDMGSVRQERLARTVAQVSRWYPDAEMISPVWHNWPNHAHALLKQAVRTHTRVRVLWLPTYAPWLNPIETLWRRTRQAASHAHPWCDGFHEFRNQVRSELLRFTTGSQELLQYVGPYT